MKRDKQLRVLETKGRYEVRDGRLYTKGREKVASVINGYRQHIIFNGRGWGREVAYEHEIIYLYERGVYEGVIDHLNSIRDDNRIENLEAVSCRENVLRSRTPMDWDSWNDKELRPALDLLLGGSSYSAVSRATGMDRCSIMYHAKHLASGKFSRYLTMKESVEYGERLKKVVLERKRL